MDVSINDAIYGRFNTTESAQSLFSCATGNCTWPTFNTLAVFESCLNITDQIQKDIYSRNYYIPGYDIGFIEHSISDVNLDTALLNVTSYANSREAGTGRVILANFSAIGYGYDSIIAENCILEYCVQSIQSISTSGVLSEKVLANFTQWECSENITYDTSSPATITTFNLRPTYDFAYGGDTWRQSISMLDNLQENFTIDTFEYMMSSLWFTEVIEFVVIADDEGWVYNSSDPGIAEAMSMIGVGKFPILAAAMAASVTATMRIDKNVWEAIENGPQIRSSTNFVGTAYEIVPTIKVAWPWLTFPVLVELGGVSFVFLTIYLSSRSKAKLWKAGVLPLLFHGPSDESIQGAGMAEKLHAMAVQSETIKVHLSYDDSVRSLKLLRE